MFDFRRKKKPPAGTSDTFVKATGGGWGEPPDEIAADGGSQAGFVGQTLERAYAHAVERGIPVGGEFKFTITEIPDGIISPHEIIVGIMMRAGDYGLLCGAMTNEVIHFTRLK